MCSFQYYRIESFNQIVQKYFQLDFRINVQLIAGARSVADNCSYQSVHINMSMNLMNVSIKFWVPFLQLSYHFID